MPSLGADMEHGTVLEWRVKPGDVVHKGDIVAVVDTDKSDIEVEVFEDGVVEDLVVAVGQEVPVGTVLAHLAPAGAAAPAPAAPPKARKARPRRRATPPPGRPMVSPYARRLAAERGIDLAAVTGTGPGGAVLARDVDEAPAAPPGAAEVPALTGGLAPRVAAAMARSKREIPHYHLTRTVDLTTPLEWLRRTNDERPVAERLLPAAVLLAAIARGLAEVPRCNGHWVDGAFRPSPTVELGVAISERDGGLVAPVIADAARLTVDELMARLKELTTRVRRGVLRAADLAEPSVTVTNLGDRGADSVLGVIFPPQVALVGIGRLHDEVVAVDGMPAVRPAVVLTLAADHRVTGGHEGSRCVDAIVAWLERPADLRTVSRR